jgi:hypothetical protein
MLLLLPEGKRKAKVERKFLLKLQTFSQLLQARRGNHANPRHPAD